MLFTETYENDDDDVCYDIDSSLYLPPEELGTYKYEYDIIDYEDLNEIDEFLEYCIQTLGQQDDVQMD